jgi:hypothetical protein
MLGLFAPSGNRLINATLDEMAPEFDFDDYYVKGTSLTQANENGFDVILLANHIVHRNRSILDHIVLVSLDEIFIDQLELNVKANETSPPQKNRAKALMESIPIDLPKSSSASSEILTRILVDNFTAVYSFEDSTKLELHSRSARLYEDLYIFEGGVTITSSLSGKITTVLAIWDKTAGGFLMPYGYQSNTSNVDGKKFLFLTDNGALVRTDYYPENNWESVDVVDQMSHQLVKQIYESLGMFFLKTGSH